METTLVVLIVAAAVAWASRATWRALRPRRRGASGSSCGCPSSGTCTVARNCTQAAPAPAQAAAEDQDSVARPT